MARVTGVIPELVKAFEERVKPGINVAPLAAVADALSKGETPPAIPDDLSVGSAAEAAPVMVQLPEATEVEALGAGC